MIAGKCGCAECERQERDRQEAHHTSRGPVVRSSCDDDDAAPPEDALPPFEPPAEVVALAPPDAPVVLPSDHVDDLLGTDPFAPPTRPPRAG
jgi:hypothetical protein